MNGSGSSETTGSAIGLRPKALLVDRSHNPWREADRRAAYGKSVRAVRGGGGWRRTHPGTAPVLDPTNSSFWPRAWCPRSGRWCASWRSARLAASHPPRNAKRSNRYRRRRQLAGLGKETHRLLAAFGIPSLDFALGEPGQEEVMLQVSTAGSFPFPRIVAAGTRVSVRAADLAGHDVQVRVSWSDAI